MLAIQATAAPSDYIASNFHLFIKYLWCQYFDFIYHDAILPIFFTIKLLYYQYLSLFLKLLYCQYFFYVFIKLLYCQYLKKMYLSSCYIANMFYVLASCCIANTFCFYRVAILPIFLKNILIKLLYCQYLKKCIYQVAILPIFFKMYLSSCYIDITFLDWQRQPKKYFQRADTMRIVILYIFFHRQLGV